MAFAQALGDDQFHHLLVQRILAQVTECAFRGGIEFRDAAFVVKSNDAIERGFQDRALAHFTLAERFLAAFALDHLPELVADRCERLQQFGIRLGRLRAEKLQHMQHFIARLDRDAECGLHAIFRGYDGVYRAARRRKIGHPCRLATSPRPCRAGPTPPGESERGGFELEVVDVDVCAVPDFAAFQCVLLGIHIPDRAHVPLEESRKSSGVIFGRASATVAASLIDAGSRVLQIAAVLGPATFTLMSSAVPSKQSIDAGFSP